MEQTVFRVLKPRHRELIINKLTDRQKHFIKKFMFAGKWQRREINEVKHRLYNLGFTKRGLTELQNLVNKKDEPYLNRLALWELALWHANQYTERDARKCLELLSKSLQEEKDSVKLRQTAIMQAECLEIIGDIKSAKNIISSSLASEQHPDLLLAASNLESSMSSRLTWINKVFSYYKLSPVSLDNSQFEKLPAYDCLVSETRERTSDAPNDTSNPKITVIMPVYNAEDVIQTSLDSVLAQTWTNLEVFVIDDCSKDNTVTIVEGYAEKDSRVKLLKALKNGGAYVARNQALKQATGDYVTVHDADDWSHPQKMETQVNHLIKNPELKGNTSEQARATNELKFYRRGKPGTYIFSNMSSFMFRREVVTESLGYWDSVRFAADSEFIRRIKKVFGEKSIAEVPTGPLSFQRQTSTSLTGNSAFGYHGYKMGVRREYEESHDYFHNISDDLYYNFPLVNRPFAVPEPMWSEREEKLSGQRIFDLVLVSDFRTDTNNIIDSIKELRSVNEKGFKIGLVQMSKYEVNPDKKVEAKLRDQLDGKNVQMLVYGEKIKCETLIIKTPSSLQEWQKHIPEVSADKVQVEVGELPVNDKKEVNYDIIQCEKNLQEYFKRPGTWYPVNEDIRTALLKNYPEELNSVNLASGEKTGGV